MGLGKCSGSFTPLGRNNGFEVCIEVHQPLISLPTHADCEHDHRPGLLWMCGLRFLLKVLGLKFLVNQGSPSLQPGPLKWLSGGVALPTLPAIYFTYTTAKLRGGGGCLKPPHHKTPPTQYNLTPADLSPPSLVIFPNIGSLPSGHINLLTVPPTRQLSPPQGLCTCSARCLECPFPSSLPASFLSREACPDPRGPARRHLFSTLWSSFLFCTALAAIRKHPTGCLCSSSVSPVISTTAGQPSTPGPSPGWAPPSHWCLLVSSRSFITVFWMSGWMDGRMDRQMDGDRIEALS